MKIENCPFCDGKGEVYENNWENQNSYGYPEKDYCCVKCEKCGARGGIVAIQYMNTFTEYMVEDFKRDPLLREIEMKRYGSYVVNRHVEAIAQWNMRKDDYWEGYEDGCNDGRYECYEGE